MEMHMKQVYKLWKMKTISVSGILKTKCYNDSYLSLFRKRILRSCENSLKKFPLS